MQDEAIYRCINAGCVRGMPRRVQYCPYCGTAQQAGAPPPRDEDRGRGDAAAAVATAAGAEAVAGLSGWSDAPDTTVQQAPPPPPKPAPSATAFGRSGRPVEANSAPPSPPERGRGIPWSPHPTPPPAPKPAGRQPIRLRWWIVALAVLWGVWLWAKPSAKKIDKRIDAAIALAQACQGKQAQDELIALRSSRATPQQLERLQRGLNEASSACTRKRQRASAWAEARGPIESALASGSVERARSRLQAFTKRWGEDDNTRALKARIDAARAEHPLAIPPDA
ncbi:hypothetical protein SAMN05428966_101548 [Massilia sp. PDC64]|nr:hypothetical protein [Massilia sp. PDC64]SDC32411.1 hypothetical protein SAMN05428966_101548 [Massilia sp. PDC64]